MQCSKCNKEIEEGTKFCPYCGHKVSKVKKENKVIEISLTKLLLILLGVILLITVITLIFVFNKNTEVENKNIVDSIQNENLVDTNIANSTLEENSSNFLEEIKEKYPTESGMICTNGTDYWLLDEKGDKLYFYDLASFEEALKLCVDYTEEATENQIEAEQPQNDIENSKNNYSNSSSYVDIPSLQGMTEEEAIKKAKELNVPYEIVYREDLSYDKEGIVIGQTTHTKIITDGGGDIVAAYNLTVLYPGETLAIVINKYEDRKINFNNIHIVCLIEEYLKLCEQKGEKINKEQFSFDIKINNKIVHNEIISKARVENLIKKGLQGHGDYENTNEIIDESTIDWFLIFGDCGVLNNYSYTGYGEFDLELLINGVTVAKHHCNMYNQEDGITETFAGEIKAFISYNKKDNNEIDIEISYKEHGGYG